ncbi:MAG: hypothetical protein HZB53_02465 [Chloroflexi bacterium]|nr:hypothetical protein [Chloroflexota bacterium]
MSDDVLVSYTTYPVRGRSSALRIYADGRVEDRIGEQAWKAVTRLGPRQIADVRKHLHASGIFERAASAATPAATAHGGVCTWLAHDNGRRAEVTVEPWNDDNPAATPLRLLALQMDAVIGAAQDGRIE